MLVILLNSIICAVSGIIVQSENTYKILFFSLLGIVILSSTTFLIHKNRKRIFLLLEKPLYLLKKYIPKVNASINGLLTRPIAGFAYSKEQNIFYSTLDAWQRSFGYSRFYDEAATHFGMIVDSEPVYFDYDGKSWLIEFWKGQYGITTGCEAGVYNTNRPLTSILGFNDTFYDCADNEDMLFFSYVLYKNAKKLFSRKGKHWWLTGFILGEFSQPSELVMNISLTLKDNAMLDAFIGGIRNTGYLDNEITIDGNTVNFIFSKPHSAQPHSRTKENDAYVQRYNKLNCERFTELTQNFNSTASKIAVIRKQDPSIYKSIMNMGGSKKAFFKYGFLKKLGL